MYTNNYNSNKEVISAARDIEINVLEFLIDQLTLPWVARLHSEFYLTFSGKAAKEEGLGSFVHIVQELCIWLSSYLHPMLQQVP